MKRYLLIIILLVLLAVLTISACSGETITKTVTPPATTTTTTLPPQTKTMLETQTITVTAQAETIEEGWVRLNIKDVGSIEYPIDFLELQSGFLANITELSRQTWQLPEHNFTLQQVGLNDLEPASFLTYRRIMFWTEYLNPGEEVPKTNEREIFSELEFSILETYVVEQLKQEFQTMGISLVESVSLEIKEVNGMFPLVHTYKRQLNDNPIVLVQSYMFNNYDMIHYLVFSYRVEDEEVCKDIYNEILASFRLY